MIFTKYQGAELDKVIYKKGVRINTEYIRSADKRSIFKQVDDQKIVVDQSGISYIEVVLYSGIILIYIILEHFNFFKKKETDDIFIIAFCIFLFICILNACKGWRQVFVFDRQAGTISYNTYWGFCTETVPFSQAIAINGKQGLRSATPNGLAFVSQDRRFRCYIHYYYPYAALSFYVWYMDKNRPLPLGTAFDAYREADYRRRRYEGFPEPLYMSAIETVEWEGATSIYNDKGAAQRGLLKYDPILGVMPNQMEDDIPDNESLSY